MSRTLDYWLGWVSGFAIASLIWKFRESLEKKSWTGFWITVLIVVLIIYGIISLTPIMKAAGW